MSKFYFTSLASKPMRLGGREFKFKICTVVSGKASGFYEATDPDEIAILDDAVRGRRGISAMSEVEGESAKKKEIQIRTSSSSNGSSPRVIQITLLPQLAVEAVDGAGSTGAKADGSHAPREESAPVPAPSIGSLLRIERINPPKPFTTADAKLRKSASRADKAKIRLIRKHV